MSIREDTINTTIEKIIDKTPTKDLKILSVKELSKKVDSNENIIYKQYKNKRHFCISKLIFYRKLQKAYGLLKTNSDLSIKEISNTIGYKKTEYFGQIIKKTFGKTPSEIRNKNKTK